MWVGVLLLTSRCFAYFFWSEKGKVGGCGRFEVSVVKLFILDLSLGRAFSLLLVLLRLFLLFRIRRHRCFSCLARILICLFDVLPSLVLLV